jgi:F0F1-type ATP synthase membrane subunit a
MIWWCDKCEIEKWWKDTHTISKHCFCTHIIKVTFFFFSICALIIFQWCTAYYNVFLVEIKTNIFKLNKSKKKPLKEHLLSFFSAVINNVMHKLYHLSCSLVLFCVFLIYHNAFIYLEYRLNDGQHSIENIQQKTL